MQKPLTRPRSNDQEQNAACQGGDSDYRRKRNLLLGLGGGLNSSQVQNFLMLRIRDALIGERENSERNQQDTNENTCSQSEVLSLR